MEPARRASGLNRSDCRICSWHSASKPPGSNARWMLAGRANDKESVMRTGKTFRSNGPPSVSRPRSLPLAATFVLSVAIVCAANAVQPAAYPGAGHTPQSQRGWEKFQTQPDPDAPLDEAQGGLTQRKTPVYKRDE